MGGELAKKREEGRRQIDRSLKEKYVSILEVLYSLNLASALNI